MSQINIIKQQLHEIYNVTGIPISTITDEDDYQMLQPYAPITEYNISHAKTVREMVKDLNLTSETPYIMHLFFSCYYAILPINENIIIQLGPVGSHEMNITKYISDVESIHPSYVTKEHIRILRGTPRVDLDYFENVVVLTTNYLCQKNITKKSIIISPDLLIPYNNTVKSFNRSSQAQMFMAFDSKLFQIIKNGDIIHLEEYVKKYNMNNTYYFIENDISYIRLMSIFYAAICCHYASLGGVAPLELKEIFMSFVSEISMSESSKSFDKKFGDFTFLVCEKVHNILHSDKASDILAICTHYINDHLYDKISMNVLENISKSSRKTIHRHFREQLNTTPSGYIFDKKLSEAEDLLINTNLSILDISSMLVFSSQSYLTQCFKKRNGCTPAQFRKNNRNKPSDNKR